MLHPLISHGVRTVAVANCFLVFLRPVVVGATTGSQTCTVDTPRSGASLMQRPHPRGTLDGNFDDSFSDSRTNPLRSDLRFETDVSKDGLAATTRAANLHTINGRHSVGGPSAAQRLLNLLQVPDDSMWMAAGCTESIPHELASSSTEDLVDVATSHDVNKQKECYGHAFGDSIDHMFPSRLLGVDKQVQKVECDKDKAARFRRDSNISVDEVAQESKRVMFQNVVRAFRTMGVPVIMTSGLLLGWWRECDFLSHDHDMDVGVLHRFLPDDFIQQLDALGFSVAIRVPAEARFQDVHDNIGLEVTLKMKNRITGPDQYEPYMDVFVWEESGVTVTPDQHEVHYVQHSLWPGGETHRFWNCTQEFESLALTHWNDVDVWVPNPPVRSLKALYGDTWNVLLTKGWCVYCNCNKHELIPRQPWQKRWQLADVQDFLAVEASLGTAMNKA